MPDKPSITDKHLQKYEEIMKTGTLNSEVPAPPPSSSKNEPDDSAQKSKISQLLSNLPKPKGVGGKMFIFNGKKKIIMEGGEKEVEKAKTIDAKEIKKLQKKENSEEKPQEPPKPIRVEEDTETEKKLEKKIEGKKEENTENKKKKSFSNKKLIIGGIILVVIWTLLWAYFLGFFSLIGL